MAIANTEHLRCARHKVLNMHYVIQPLLTNVLSVNIFSLPCLHWRKTIALEQYVQGNKEYSQDKMLRLTPELKVMAIVLF